MTSIPWTFEDVICGIEVKAYFFNPNAIPIGKHEILPFLDANRLVTIVSERDHRRFRYKNLVAETDHVFLFERRPICVEYKSKGEVRLPKENWQKKVRLKDMLQCISAGFAIAQERRELTACVLRYHNVCLFLNPNRAIVEIISESISHALGYYTREETIGSSLYAGYLVEKINAMFPNKHFEKERQAGIEAHRKLLDKY